MGDIAIKAKAEIAERESGGNIMQIIAEAARNPNVDVDKLERLLAMSERVGEREAKAAYFAAMSEMQDELPSIVERGEIKIGSGAAQKYALWEDINKAIKPVLKKHGFALSFRTGMSDTKITVTGVLSHAQGHSEETTIHLPSDTSGSKNAVQAVGSSTSYGKRYTASALLNLTSGGEDDDGRFAGGDDPVSADQLQGLQDMIERSGADVELFCKHMKVSSLSAILARDFGRACEALNLKMRAKK